MLATPTSRAEIHQHVRNGANINALKPSEPSECEVPVRLSPALAWCLLLASAGLWWLTGPPICWGLAAFLALVPWLWVVDDGSMIQRRGIYVGSFLYHMAALQGLRHAHPLMIFAAIALAAYLAIFPWLSITLWKRFSDWSTNHPVVRRSWPIWRPLALGAIWIGWEWVRNYLGTGISVLMLGHTLAEMPIFIQIADLFGSYGVSFVVAVVNVAVFDIVRWAIYSWKQRSVPWTPLPSLATGSILLVLTLYYGSAQLDFETEKTGKRVLLLARNERTEYEVNPIRQAEVYDKYARQTVVACNQVGDVDAVVWPESMMSGNLPWMSHDATAGVPPLVASYDPTLTKSQFAVRVAAYQDAFQQRAVDLQSAIQGEPPVILGGCSVVDYGDPTRTYSGLVMVDRSGRVAHTYRKNHLVMIGEYVPVIQSIPWLRDWIPPGMGIDAGSKADPFELGGLTVLPNICIETAVERVAIGQLRRLSPIPVDAIITVTNDAWFNGTAVVEHHLRCSQMLAVGSRKPILSAANGGPTAWIDSNGIVVQRLAYDAEDAILAEPRRDSRRSFYTRAGDLPAALCGWGVLITWFFSRLWKTNRSGTRVFRWQSMFRSRRRPRAGRTES